VLKLILLEEVLLVFIGLIIGVIGSFMGVGGGFILVPTLILLFSFEAHHAVGTSIAIVLFTGLSSFIAYSGQKRVDWKTGLTLEIVTAPGALLGSYATEFVSSKNLELLFVFLLFWLAYQMWRERDRDNRAFGEMNIAHGFVWKRRITDAEGNILEYNIKIFAALILSFFAGFSSGFFGIGGGIMKVPFLIYSGMPVHIAIATSSLMVTITALSALIGHASLADVQYVYLLFLVPGVLTGAQIGARIAKGTKPKMLRKFFSLMLLVISILMLMELP